MPSYSLADIKENTCQPMSSSHENIPLGGSQNIPLGGNQAEPDADTIKMFVGQVPRHYDEEDLRKMFSKYGPVYNVTVLRDKQKGQSKGCCFVTFFKRQHSLDAQNDLHNLKTMPGMSHPIQMKPADSEKRNVEERKLFVGMISKKWTESEVRVLFAPFGTIEECTILRENNESKGCAFVTYGNKQSAFNAIKNIHHSQTMEGCRSPVVVKIADTQKDKEMRKMQQINNNILTAAQQMPLTALCPQYLTLLQQALGSGNMGALATLGLNNSLSLQQLLSSGNSHQAANNPSVLTNLLAQLLASGMANGNQQNQNHQMAGGHSQQAGGPAGGAASHQQGGTAHAPSGDMNNMQNLQHLQSLALLANLANSPAMNAMNLQNLQLLNQLSSNSSSSGLSGLTSTASLLSKSGMFGDRGDGHRKFQPHRLPAAGSPIISLSDMMTPTSSSGNLSGSMSMSTGNLASLNGFGSNAMTSSSPNPSMEALYTGLQQYAASFPSSMSGQASQLQHQKLMAGNESAAGPDGANLFIYHLPQEFSDHDLMQTFMPFGNVVSSKVFIDKQTKLSKCFGFVSYDNPLSAHAAIQNMNGFQIGTKRLKVQLKRPKSDAKPY